MDTLYYSSFSFLFYPTFLSISLPLQHPVYSMYWMFVEWRQDLTQTLSELRDHGQDSAILAYMSTRQPKKYSQEASIPSWHKS